MADTKNKTGGSSSGRDGDEDRRNQLAAIQKRMDELCESHQRSKQDQLLESEAAIEAYAEYAKAITADQSTVDSFLDQSTDTGAESSDLKTFAKLFEVFIDKLNMLAMVPLSKPEKAKAKEGDLKVKKKTTKIESDSNTTRLMKVRASLGVVKLLSELKITPEF